MESRPAPTEPPWPPSERVVRPWSQSVRGGVKEDRTYSRVTVTVPPMIAPRDVPLDARLAAAVDSATREITALDQAHGDILTALGVLLLRTESVASSKIELIEADIASYARALHGSKANTSAASMAAATAALEQMLARVQRLDSIELSLITDAHAALMSDDPAERRYAGRLRDIQNWVGGSDHSPRGALFVPPPPDTVVGLMTDLMEFCNRTDVPPLAQASIAHAQFETIDPFTDGNGRIGRALINVVLRHRRSTTTVVVPLASALVAHRERYFSLLDAYRDGDPRPVIESFALSATVAASESRVTARRLAELPAQWHDRLGGVRAKSAAELIVEGLPSNPIFSAEEACRRLGLSPSATYAAIDRLSDADVIRPLTERTRNQVWGAVDVLDEIEDLGLRIGAAAR